MTRARPAGRPELLVIGRTAAALSLVLCVLVQWVNQDFFPPDVSVSQYGVGPRGWVFTVWVATMALAVLTLQAGGTVHEHHFGRWWLVAGSLALVVMGVVRTDADGLQQSLHARVHMVASIVALLTLPLGIALAMTHAKPRWRRFAGVMVGLSTACLVLVLVSAGGVATPGLDSQHSWALWQSVAVTLDMLLLAGFGLSSFPSNQDHRRVAAGKEAHR
jgi:hypothetical protein